MVGLPRTLATSVLVGFWPRARKTSPAWARKIFSSPVRSNKEKASRNSAFWSSEKSVILVYNCIFFVLFSVDI